MINEKNSDIISPLQLPQSTRDEIGWSSEGVGGENNLGHMLILLTFDVLFGWSAHVSWKCKIANKAEIYQINFMWIDPLQQDI